METISKYISYSEATKSDTAIKNGIDNIPNAEELSAMKNVAVKVFDKVREWLKNPLGITSFFRCEKLNSLIGGSDTSQHRFGEAIDIDCDKYGFGTNIDIFNYIKDNLEFDQLIAEFKQGNQPAWIHVSLKLQGKQRREILIARKDANNRTEYLKYTKELFKQIYE